MSKSLPQDWMISQLGDVYSLKQGKHLALSDLSEEGFTVYGANGIVGYYPEYMYEDSKVLITCRGATCGTINISKPKSWITGNAIALVPKNVPINDKYVSYYFKYAGLNEVITGSAQPQIIVSNLTRAIIKRPPLPQQEKIVTVLDTASQLVEKQKALIEKYDLFLKSKFIEMFGDPVLNSIGWEIAPLKKFGKVITGNTPSRKVDEYYNDDYIEWIKTDNISSDELYVSEASEYLSEEGMEKSRVLQKGALLTTCIAGSLKSIGNACLTDRTVCFNQQINAIQPNEDCHPLFLYAMFGVAKNYIQTFATSSMKKIITKGEFEKIEFIKPPFELQGKYAAILEKVYVMKAQEQKKLEKLQTLYDALMQRAFKGEIQ